MKKAISLWQPWGSFMAWGFKRNETRGWKPSAGQLRTILEEERGWIAIHVSKRCHADERALCERSPFREVLSVMGETYDSLPRGAVVALGKLGALRSSEEVFLELEEAATIAESQGVTLPGLPFAYEDAELEFGDYGRGRFIWPFPKLYALDNPVKCRGAQGLFDLPAEAQRAVRAEWDAGRVRLVGGPAAGPRDSREGVRGGEEETRGRREAAAAGRAPP